MNFKSKLEIGIETVNSNIIKYCQSRSIETPQSTNLSH